MDRRLNGIRALSFDLDDTLWPFRPCLERAERTLLAWLHERAPRTAALLATPDALSAYRTRAHADHPELRHDVAGLRQVSIRAILVDADEDVALVDEAYAAFFAERLRVELYADVLPALEALSRRFPLVALSNGNGCIHHAGIGHLFEGALHAQALGFAKPQPEAFHAAADLVGVRPSELLHVGDDWAFDVLGALDAGVRAAWIDRRTDLLPDERDRIREVHAIVPDLGTLRSMLDAR